MMAPRAPPIQMEGGGGQEQYLCRDLSDVSYGR